MLRVFQIHEVAFQCSRHTTPEQIIDAFNQCATYQQDRQDLEKFASVLLLDEIGLAESSESRPLKVGYTD